MEPYQISAEERRGLQQWIRDNKDLVNSALAGEPYSPTWHPESGLAFLANAEVYTAAAKARKDHHQLIEDLLYVTLMANSWLDQNMVAGSDENLATVRRMLALYMQAGDFSRLRKDADSRIDPLRQVVIRLKGAL